MQTLSQIKQGDVLLGLILQAYMVQNLNTLVFFDVVFRAAVDFLEYRFSLTDSQMLALTSKGSVLTTIAFRSEEPTAGRVKC